MIITPENLIENLDKVRAWDIYGLASDALEHYFPEEYGDGYCSVSREVELLAQLGFDTWNDVVIKYHKEVGYTENELSHLK